MFERPQSGERAILVHVSLHGTADPDLLQEFTELARSAAPLPLDLVAGQLKEPDTLLYVHSANPGV